MAKSDETNNKLPKPAPMTVKPEYPYVYEEQTLNGKKITRHDNPNKPEESFESTFNHDGSFETKQISEDYKGLTTGLSHEARTYVSGGSSSHIDGNHDTSVESTSNENVKGDKSSGVGKTLMTGAERAVGGTSEGSFHNDANGNTYKTSQGDMISEHTGSEYNSVDGDKCISISGNRIEMVDGECSLHVQSGNMDTRVESGKAQIYSLSDMTFESASKITLKVGTTTIVISSGEITATVGGINGKGISIKSDGVRITKDVHVGVTTVSSSITSPTSPKTKFI
jgi:hypothetical protein